MFDGICEGGVRTDGVARIQSIVCYGVKRKLNQNLLTFQMGIFGIIKLFCIEGAMTISLLRE